MKAVARLSGAVFLGVIGLLAMHLGAAEAGSGCHSTAMTTGSGVAVELWQNCFEPTVITVNAGDQVTWTNRDGVPHTVTAARSTWGNYEELRPDETVSFTFDEVGVFPYFCVLHPTMIGAVVVADSKALIPVGAMASSDEPAAPPAGPAEASSERNGTAVLLALVVGGVGLGLVLGLGASVGWRRWRTTRA